jgi:hypothetical protein
MQSKATKRNEKTDLLLFLLVFLALYLLNRAV